MKTCKSLVILFVLCISMGKAPGQNLVIKASAYSSIFNPKSSNNGFLVGGNIEGYQPTLGLSVGFNLFKPKKK